MNLQSRKSIIARATLLGLGVAVVAIVATLSMFRHEETGTDAMRRIRERGYLVAATDRNTLNYFIYRGEPMGFQLKLLEAFADNLGVPLRIIADDDVSRLEYYLRNKAADIIALNLPITPEGKKLARFTDPVGETRLVLVQRRARKGTTGPGNVQTLKDFPRDTVWVAADPFLSPLYHSFYRKTGRKAVLAELAGVSQDELIRRVASGRIGLALCQENVAMVYHRYYRNLDISVLAFPLYSYAWGTGPDSDTLLTRLNTWLGEYRASRDLKGTYLAYYNNQRIARFMESDYYSVNGNKLSPFDPAIREYSRIVNWDWRLVASLVYEESNFQPGQVSSRNASGLMQLMPETAAKFGVDSTSSLSAQIAGGVKYLRYLDRQLPDDITNPIERIHFVLAAYNVGIGRVLAAREKAEKFGRDHNRWNGHVDYYLLRRSRKDPVAKADTVDSFPLDYKTEGFVDDIVSRYYHYRNLVR